ncbi:CotH kinase family protein [Candidatus Nomurabacteria bacterium]|nr:CotH kinase family protein [Candidatus Nomurabacteria bacterium]
MTQVSNTLPAGTYDIGTIGALSYSGTEQVFYTWDGSRPDSSDVFFIGSVSYTLTTLDTASVYSLLSNTTNDPSLLREGMASYVPTPYVGPASVPKIHVLRTWIAGTSEYQQWSYNTSMGVHGNALVYSLVIDSLELWDSLTGLWVPGDYLNPTPFEVSFSADTGYVFTDSSMAGFLYIPGLIPGDTFDIFNITITPDTLYAQYGPSSSLVLKIAYDSITEEIVQNNITQWKMFHPQSFVDLYPLADYETGIELNYRKSSSAIDEWGMDRSIFWRQAEFTLFDIPQNTGVLFDQQCEMRVAGNYSRDYHKKASVLYFADSLGGKFNVPLFDWGSPTNRTLYLRAGGTQQFHHWIPDAFVHQAAQGLGVGARDYKVAVQYLNGEYWGHYLLRQRLTDKHMVEEPGYDWDDDDVVEYSFSRHDFSYRVEDTYFFDQNQYHDMDTIITLWQEDLSDAEHYAALQEKVNMTSFITMWHTNMYWGNGDHGSGNHGVAKPNGYGKLSFYIKDMDQSLPAYGSSNNDWAYYVYSDTTGDTALWKRWIQKGLDESPEFRQAWINILDDLISVYFDPDRVLPYFDTLVSAVAPHLDLNYQRWGQFSGRSKTPWLSWNVPVMRNYIMQRREHVVDIFKQDFDCDTTMMYVTLKDTCDRGYHALVSTLPVRKGKGLSRITHTDFPVMITVPSQEPHYFIFNGDTIVTDTLIVHPVVGRYDSITIVMECLSPPSVFTALQVNEVLPDNVSGITDEEGKYEDWFEIWNSSLTDSLSLQDLYVSDKANNLQKHHITVDTIIPPNAYVVFWADEDLSDGPMHVDFKLSKDGEGVYLSDGVTVIDSLVWNYTIPSDQSFGRCGTMTQTFLTPTPAEENCPNILLDIDLLDFSVVPNTSARALELSWRFTENNHDLTIMRSYDGVVWQEISPTTSYTQGTYTDYDIESNITYYYRLYWEDQKSNIRSGMLTEQMVPYLKNPHDSHIQAPAGYLISVYDILGKVFPKKKNMYLDHGVYIIFFFDETTGEKVHQQKILIK